ncbi:MAG TPA: D-alanyl-D-alanine carboxypeptidase family protein [Gaiellaceae bacterium]|nr:D-alanyl-D-alanine carboxypeptidase family protein [Gaiellaceae bacterium]
MSLDVLTPVAPRRRRRRYRARRVALLVLLVLLAAAAGVWFGRRSATTPHHPAAVLPPAKDPAAATTTVAHHTSPPLRPLKLLTGPALLDGRVNVRVHAPAAILVDAHTGRVLWAKRAHERRKIASLTKIMTATLALHEVPWDSTVTVDKRVTAVPLVKEGLRTGERVKAWKLFYSLLLFSGNDDAAQLAISSAGSVRGFLRQMNAEARQLGLRDTHYTTPSGVIDKGNFSTPWDLAALTRYALRSPRFKQLVSTRRIQVRWSRPTNSKIYLNNNFLLHAYHGANGVKTGYTHESGWCLVATATRHGQKLIAVVLDSPNMYSDARTLLNLGFSHT